MRLIQVLFLKCTVLDQEIKHKSYDIFCQKLISDYKCKQKLQMLGEKCQRSNRKALPPPFQNHIFTRITEIHQILTSNSDLFTKAPPSQQQLKIILEHCYNCYDQLDFIYLDYSKQSINYLDPKALADYTHKIFRSAKHLINHLTYWYDAFSLEIVKKMNEVKFSIEQHSCTRPHCFICLNNINQMKLKEAKESILGPMQWRQIYEQQLREQKEALKKLQIFEKKEQRQEYVSSVNFLARIIREMEDSSKNYEILAQKVQGQNINGEHTLFVLQQLIGKLKVKLGQKYKLKFQSKLKSMLKKMEQKNNHLAISHQMTLTQQLNWKIEPGSRKPRTSAVFLQESAILKLKEDNKRLLVQRNELNQRIDHLKEAIQKKQANGNHSRSVSRKNTTQAKYEDIEENQYSHNQFNKPSNTLLDQKQKNVSPQHSLQGNYTQSKMKRKVKNLIGRMSAFNLKKTQIRKSQLSEFVEKTIEKDKLDEQENQGHWANEETYSNESKNSINSSIVRNIEQEAGVKQIGCQWEQNIYDSLNATQPVIAKSHSKKRKPTLVKVQKENEESMSLNKLRYSNLLSSNNIIPSIGTKKSLVGDKNLAKYNSNDNKPLRQQKSAANLRENHKVQDQIKEHPRESANSINLEHTAGDDKQKNAIKRFKYVQGDLKYQTSYQKKRIAKVDLASKNQFGIQMKNTKFQTNLQKKHDLTFYQIKPQKNKKQKMSYLKARVATEQIVTLKKDKVIRNIIFKPEHLTIFGGVSQSYSYQTWKIDQQVQKLSVYEQQTLKGLKAFIQSLKSFKNGLYQNILSFMSKPFSTIQKNQIDFKPLSSQKIEKVLLKMFLFHKKKCGCVSCVHLQHFCEIIGYYLKI